MRAAAHTRLLVACWAPSSPCLGACLQVTLVCSGELLERMDAQARKFAAAWLGRHGVEVLTNERVRSGARHGPPQLFCLLPSPSVAFAMSCWPPPRAISMKWEPFAWQRE